MNEEERKLRDRIAYNIRAELVCCNKYESLELLREEVAAQKPGWGESYSELMDQMDGHEICYWGEVAAQIAENPTK